MTAIAHEVAVSTVAGNGSQDTRKGRMEGRGLEIAFCAIV